MEFTARGQYRFATEKITILSVACPLLSPHAGTCDDHGPFAAGDNGVLFGPGDGRLTGAAHTASGLVAGGIGVLSVMYQRSAIPDAHQGLELRAIACVVVGGLLPQGDRE
jgi:hypothetical protein